MKVGIMQPYFLPYIGYWQLLNVVDQYVIYDDVNFIKGGWINRNRILVRGKPQYINVQMDGASSFKKINEVGIDGDMRWRKKLLKTIEMAYGKAIYYQAAEPLIHDIVMYEADNLAAFITHSIKRICEYLHIDTKILISSELEHNVELHGQDRVLDICRRLHATEYYNAIGGQAIYSKEKFLRAGIKLCFLSTEFVEYKQYGYPFVPALSILDMMMFNSANTISRFLSLYTLV